MRPQAGRRRACERTRAEFPSARGASMLVKGKLKNLRTSQSLTKTWRGGETVAVAEVEVSARDLGDGRYQAIIRDISERRRLEEQLRAKAQIDRYL